MIEQTGIQRTYPIKKPPKFREFPPDKYVKGEELNRVMALYHNWAMALSLDMQANLDKITRRLNEVLFNGTTGNKPDAGVRGRLYWDDTLGRLEYDNGTTWTAV